jgi:hypothetical protein
MATMSPPSSTDKPGVETHYRKPRVDLYTLLLAIALVAILIGIIFLCMYNSEFQWKTKESIQTSMSEGWRTVPWLLGILG